MKKRLMVSILAGICICITLGISSLAIARKHFTLKEEGSYLELPVSLNPETNRVAEGTYGGRFEIWKTKEPFNLILFDKIFKLNFPVEEIKLSLSGEVKTVLRRDETREGFSLFGDGALSAYYRIEPELILRLDKQREVSLSFIHWCYHYFDGHTEDVMGRENLNMVSLSYKKSSSRLSWQVSLDVNQNNRIVGDDYSIRWQISRRLGKFYLKTKSELTSSGRYLSIGEIGVTFPARYGRCKVFLRNINKSGFFLSTGKAEKGIYLGLKIEFS